MPQLRSPAPPPPGNSLPPHLRHLPSLTPLANRSVSLQRLPESAADPQMTDGLQMMIDVKEEPQVDMEAAFRYALHYAMFIAS